MIYYRIIKLKNETYISKYEVILKKEKLEKIRNEMISSCSQIIHHKYKTTSKPNYYDTHRIINYRDTKTGLKGEYLVEYDELIHPLEVNLLSEVIKENNIALEELLDIVYGQDKVVVDTYEYYARLEEAQKEENAIKELLKKGKIDQMIGISKLKLIEEKIKEIELYIKLNKDRKKTSAFYQVIRESFEMIPGEILTTDELKKTLDFFEYDKDKSLIDKRISRIRKKIK